MYALVASMGKGGEKASPVNNAAVKDPDIERLEKKLSSTVGTKVLIKHNNKGRGKIEISYSSLDELDGVLSHIT